MARLMALAAAACIGALALAGCGEADDETPAAPANNAEAPADATNATAANATAAAPANAVDPEVKLTAAQKRRAAQAAAEAALLTPPEASEGDRSAATALPAQTDDAPPTPARGNVTGAQ